MSEVLLLSRRRAEDLRGGPELSLGRFAIRLSHLGGQTDHGGGKAHVIRAWRAFFVEFGWRRLRIEGARSHFNDARPYGHRDIIAGTAPRRHPDAMGMKPQTEIRVYRS